MPGMATTEHVCPTVLDAEGGKDDRVLDLDANKVMHALVARPAPISLASEKANAQDLDEDAAEQMPDRLPNSDVEEVQRPLK